MKKITLLLMVLALLLYGAALADDAEPGLLRTAIIPKVSRPLTCYVDNPCFL